MATKRSKRKWIIFGGLALLLIGLGVWALMYGKHEEVITVQSEKVLRRTITQVVTATGKIQPVIKADIAPEVSGEIIELRVKEGDQVRKGELLFRIKPDVYMAARDQAAAGVSGAKSQLAQTKAGSLKAEQDMKRIKELHDRKLVSDQENDAALAAVDIAAANQDAAGHTIEQSLATLKQTEESLRKTSVFAPIDGTITALNSQLGERVLGTQQFNGTTVLTISDMRDMEVRVDVDENDVVLIHDGDSTRIDVDAYPDRKFQGIVYQIANSAQTKGLGTQGEVTNFQVRIRIANPDVQFRPGMSANVTIATSTKVNVLSVPLQSVTTRMDKMKSTEKSGGSDDKVKMKQQDTVTNERPPSVVFLVKNGVANVMHVKTGISSNAHVEILEGLNENDEVVSGSFRAISKDLEDGKKIMIENGNKNSTSQSKP